jgi:hypothetical protein
MGSTVSIIRAEYSASIRPDRRLVHAQLGLVLVGLLFLVLQLVLIPRPFGLSVDEATYLAKVDPSAPELYWGEQRAWGMPVLAAPVAAFSSALGIVRTYFAVLSSVGLVAAFWPWLRLLRPYVAPLAALLFSSTWFTIFFGAQVMPNLYAGLAAVAAVGLLLRAVEDGMWWRVALTGAAAAALALVRPTDSVLVVTSVVAFALVVPRLRRAAPLAALIVGGALGWLPWIVEAFVRFGDPISRLQAAEEAGPKGLFVDLTNLVAFPRLLDGSPLYFSGNSPADAGPLQLVFVAWLVALVLLVALGLGAAATERRLSTMLLVCLPAALLAAFYLTLTSVTALRFVLPVFALLSLPVSVALVHLLSVTRGSVRTVAATFVAVGVAGHVVGMTVMAVMYLDRSAVGRDEQLEVAEALRPLVERERCLVVGVEQQPTSYYLGCGAQQDRTQGAETPAKVTDAEAAGWDIVAVLPEPPARASYLASWQAFDVPGLPDDLTAYRPPG